MQVRSIYLIDQNNSGLKEWWEGSRGKLFTRLSYWKDFQYMGLSVMRLTTGRSNSEWMLQGDKMPTKTKEKWEVKAAGFK